MRRRLFGIVGTALIGAALGGCVQMTRHSNTLVFGTNTSFGVKVGADATSTPGITVGYSRQEAVIIPVVANTADNGDTQAPCPQTVAQGTVKAKLPDNCRLIATSHNDADTLSVMANFGSKYAANGGTASSAKGEISQYFATGWAARLLAARAGAAAISTSDGAIAASEGQAERLSAIGESRVAVAGNIRKATVLADFLKKLDSEVGSVTDFQEVCIGIAENAGCAALVERGGVPRGLSVKDWSLAASVKP